MWHGTAQVSITWNISENETTWHDITQQTYFPSAEGLCADSSLLLSSPFSVNEINEYQSWVKSLLAVETYGCLWLSKTVLSQYILPKTYFSTFFQTAAQNGCRKDEQVKQMGAMSAQGHAVFCRQQTLGPHWAQWDQVDFENVERSESSQVGRVIKKAVWASRDKGKRPDMSQRGGKKCEESLVRCSRWGPTENKTSTLHGSCGRVWG